MQLRRKRLIPAAQLSTSEADKGHSPCKEPNIAIAPRSCETLHIAAAAWPIWRANVDKGAAPALLAAGTSSAAAQAQGHSSTAGMFTCRGSGVAEHALCAHTSRAQRHSAQLARVLLNDGLWAGGGGAGGQGHQGAGAWAAGQRRGQGERVGEAGVGQIMRITDIYHFISRSSALRLRHLPPPAPWASIP